MAEFVERHGPCQLGAKPAASQRFETLANAIVSQQLAGAAADTIWGRLRVGFGRAFSLAETPTAVQLAPLGDPFRPYRSVLAWYCWRAVTTPAK
jgi:3-methyladenine DNA glycosylase/8-oxoguanine DNA glycosylase